MEKDNEGKKLKEVKLTQQEWFDLLPFFSGYFVDNEYHDGGPQAHRNKVYKLSFILDSLQYNNVTTIFPNDYRTQNPNPQPALRHDQATTYHLTKIKEIGEYTVTFYIKSVSIYGQSKKVISNANGDIVNYFNIKQIRVINLILVTLSMILSLCLFFISDYLISNLL